MFRLFLLLMLIGCGTVEPKTVETIKDVPIPFYIDKSKVDDKLLPYVMEFAGYCEKFKTNTACTENFKKILSIKTVSSFKEKQVVGKCLVTTSGERWIEILDGWQDLDSLSMRAVVIHELGHCTLAAGKAEIFPHYDDEDDIMNSYLLPEKILFYTWPTLIKAMFTRAGGKLSLTSQTEVASVTSTMIDESGGLSCEKEN